MLRGKTGHSFRSPGCSTPKVRSLPFELLAQVFKFGLPNMEAGCMRSRLSQGHLAARPTAQRHAGGLAESGLQVLICTGRDLTSAPAGSETSCLAFLKIRCARDSQDLSSTQYFWFCARVSAGA